MKVSPASAFVVIVGLLAVTSGTAYATSKIDGHSIKVHSIPGNRVVKSTFAPNSRVQASGFVPIPATGKETVIFKRPPLTWLADCSPSGGGDGINLYVKSSESANFTGNTGVGETIPSTGLLIDTASNTEAESSGIQYTVVGGNRTTYSGIFTIFIHLGAAPCAASVTAIG